MRVFTAIDLPEPILENLEELIAKLKPSAYAKWIRPENLHITTKFIGEWPGEQIDEIRAALLNTQPFTPVPVKISGLRLFPNETRPRLFWAGIEPSPELMELQQKTEAAVGWLGVPMEDRPYNPHLTLARIKEPIPIEPLKKSIAELPSLDFGEFVADRFYLYYSRLTPTGSVYSKLTEFLAQG